VDTKEQVAIKSVIRIRPGMDLPKNSKESVTQREKRIFREASVLYLLKHPNIVGLRDFFICDEYFCMIFEYVEGIQMLDYIISNGKLKEKAAIKFMRQLVSAVGKHNEFYFVLPILYRLLSSKFNCPSRFED
jgi:serine/threonine protein kinase